MNQQKAKTADAVFFGAMWVAGGAVVVGMFILMVRSIPDLPTSEPIIQAKPPAKKPRDWGELGKDAGKGAGSFARGIVTGAIEGVLGSKEKEDEEKPSDDTKS